VPDIAKKAHSSPTQVKIALRELEFEDELISEIVPPGHGSKAGGARNTVQYQINVEAIARLLELQPLIKMVVANSTANQTGNSTGETDTHPVTRRLPVGQLDGYTSTNSTATRLGTDHNEPANEPSNQPFLKTAAGRLAQIFGQETGETLPGGTSKKNQALVAEAMKIAPDQVVKLWKHWLNSREKGVDGLNWPLSVFVSELPGLLAATSGSNHESPEETAAMQAQVRQQAAQAKIEIEQQIEEKQAVEDNALANVDKWF
jgi:hypothetical protein